MPTVVGQSSATATSVLQAKGLTVGPPHGESEREAHRHRAGHRPAPRAHMHKGESVTLTVSTGPAAATVLVPHVVGQQLTVAEEVLHDAKLKYTIKYVTSTAAAGTVLAQTPQAGRTAPTGSTVILSVPKATTTITVPSVVGLTPVKAASAIGAKGLQAGEHHAVLQHIPQGAGHRHHPGGRLAGGQERHGGPDRVLGRCQAVVPNVLGVTKNTAVATLTTKGFTNVVARTTTTCKATQSQKVVTQSPKAGTTVTTGKPVTILICTPTTPTTNPISSPQLVVNASAAPGKVAPGLGFTFSVTSSLGPTGTAATHAPVVTLNLPSGAGGSSPARPPRPAGCAPSHRQPSSPAPRASGPHQQGHQPGVDPRAGLGARRGQGRLVRRHRRAGGLR